MFPQTIFLNGLKSESWQDVRWLNSVFGITEDEQPTVEWHVVRRDDGFYCNVPGEGYVVVKHPDKDVPLVSPDENFTVPAKAWSEIVESEDILTTAGNAYMMRLTHYAVGPDYDLPWLQGKVTAGMLEDLLVNAITDDDKYDANKRNQIKASDVPKAIDAFYALTSYSHLFAPSVPLALMLPPPGMIKFKNDLFKEYEGRLDEPAVIATITSKMNDYIDAYLETDAEVAEFAINRKKVVRVSYMKRMGMVGGSSAFRTDGKMHLIKNSLYEGLDFNDFPAVQNEAREGSFLRGAETALGGEWTKFIYRILQNTKIQQAFCGVTKTKQVLIDKNNSKSYLNLYAKEAGKPVLITGDYLKANMDKVIHVYSQKYCQAEMPDYCGICAGLAMAERPEAAAQDSADVGSLFMGLSMSAMHGKELKTSRMLWKSHLT